MRKAIPRIMEPTMIWDKLINYVAPIVHDKWFGGPSPGDPGYGQGLGVDVPAPTARAATGGGGMGGGGGGGMMPPAGPAGFGGANFWPMVAAGGRAIATRGRGFRPGSGGIRTGGVSTAPAIGRRIGDAVTGAGIGAGVYDIVAGGGDTPSGVISGILAEARSKTGQRITTKKIVSVTRQVGFEAAADIFGLSIEEIAVVWMHGTRRRKRRWTRRDMMRGRAYIGHLERCAKELDKLRPRARRSTTRSVSSRGGITQVSNK